MNQDITLKRLEDLANTAYLRGIPVFTDFLDLGQQTEYNKYIMSNKMPPVKTSLSGGLIFLETSQDYLERKVACFYPYDTYCDIIYPISILEIKPVNKKFADDLSHRDFLGAIMNLGIERHLLGDILVADKMAYIFIISKMADFVCDNLLRIRHTTVSTSLCSNYDFNYTPVFKEEKGSVASERIDAVIAFAFNVSRNESALFISSGKVFVNGVQTVSKSYVLKYGDIVTVRGKGRFVFDEVAATTKKGRYFIKIRKYI